MTVVPTGTAEEPQPPPVVESTGAVSLPEGDVPRTLVGDWTGGEGAKTGQFLVIASDGRYARTRAGSQEPEEGVLVVQGSRMTFYLATGEEQTARYEYTNAAGIEVLGITYDAAGYYSYVRA
ncbi:hypothetical protein [Couchioplanes azureus]|uniref:hypothetical protein n=1 Tax=Couchioplanes caeruleus TaxID=56438 RepID=UPI00166F6FB7|nr:hypothetical protein [Couchioplanes caeruleus]